MAVTCAASGPEPAPAAGTSGDLLVAHFATSVSDEGVAAGAYMRALAAGHADTDLLRKAFDAAVMAGSPDALALARELPLLPTATLALADDAAQRGDWQEAATRFGSLPGQRNSQVMRPLLTAWAEAGAGAIDDALATLQPLILSGRYQSVMALHAAMICDQAGRTANASRYYRMAAADSGSLNLRLGMILASWQARSGQPAEARATIRALVQANPDLAIAETALQQAAATPQVRSAADGVAETYLALAASPQQDDPTLPPILLHFALAMRPGFTAARLYLAELEALAGRPALAAGTLADVPADDPLRSLADLRRAQYLDRAGQGDAARTLLRSLADRLPQRPEPLAVLAQMQRRAGLFGEAAETYGQAIARITQPGPSDWGIFYEQGISYERSHDWPRAEQDFLRALQLSPDQPAVLNYLGYSWSEQGGHLAEARRMIERAVEQQPNESAFVDSLGWVLLQQGDKADAIRYLERAAELQPEDATINSHLGDAYMAAGRAREAGVQWRLALLLKPDPEESAALTAKLAALGSPQSSASNGHPAE